MVRSAKAIFPKCGLASINAKTLKGSSKERQEECGGKRTRDKISKTIKVELTEHLKNLAETSQSEKRVYTSATPTSGGGSWLDQIQPRLHFGHKARQKISRARIAIAKLFSSAMMHFLREETTRPRGKGFPFASWKDRNRKHLERRDRSAGDVEKCEANVKITVLVETALKRLSVQKMTNARFPRVLLRITS
ncbi:hypothetical protein ALC62_08025 [Cyphomyrmex costatus]|uniref:Uncharacterized protein n=1 Tax=Cyphomyrmex costatus TaxID=456900 RepID=A0A195CKE7_9HYME|nr:hypothetical protein ALC62_08025 [Cyphomyrmex costatus]